LRDKDITLKETDKGTTSVMMSRESKINQGLALPNEKNNYQPLIQLIEKTTRNVKQLIKLLLQEGHIDDMTAKWLSLRLILRVSLFSTHLQSDTCR